MHQVFLPKNSRTGIRLREVTYNSPTLPFYNKKLTYFNKKQNRSILIKLTYWEGTHTQGASQSAGTANWTPGTVAKTVPRSLQMQQMLQVDLLLRPINLIGLVPTWHGAPFQVDHTLNRST